MRLFCLCFVQLFLLTRHCSARLVTIPYVGRNTINIIGELPFYVNDSLISSGIYRLTFNQTFLQYRAFDINLIDNNSLRVVIVNERETWYASFISPYIATYVLYHKSMDQTLTHNKHVLHTLYCMQAPGEGPLQKKHIFYAQTDLQLNNNLKVLFKTLSGVFIQNYLDCIIRIDSIYHTGQDRNVVLDTFVIDPSLPRGIEGYHSEHGPDGAPCKINVSGFYLYNVILLAHEFGHHFGSGHLNGGPFPPRPPFSRAYQNIMASSIYNHLNQDYSNVSFDLNSMVAINKNIADCFDFQLQILYYQVN